MLISDVRCPKCEAQLSDRFHFFWGAANRVYNGHPTPIAWVRNTDGKLRGGYANYGDQSVTNLWVTDQVEWSPESAPYACGTCGFEFATVIAQVVQGVITQPEVLPLPDDRALAGEEVLPEAFTIQDGRALTVLRLQP